MLVTSGCSFKVAILVVGLAGIRSPAAQVYATALPGSEHPRVSLLGLPALLRFSK